MTQACNTIFSLTEGSPLYGPSVEKQIARGSAHFASAFAEVMTLTAVAELRSPTIDCRHLAVAAAHLTAAIESYEAAVQGAAENPAARNLHVADLQRAREACEAAGMFEASVWDRVMHETSDPRGVLRAFLSGLVRCSEAVESVLAQQDHSGTISDSRLLWAITKPMADTLMFGQVAAAVFQSNDDRILELAGPAAS